MINDTRAYYNQYFDVTDRPETVKDERERTCNITCCGMILDIHPNQVFADMVAKYGMNDKFQWEENLIAYLTEHGCTCEPITKLAYPDPKLPTTADFISFKAAIDNGAVVLYHKSGHYQILVGYEDEEKWIFNDPAGDRKLRRGDRGRESGHLVVYPESMVRSEELFGRCWSVKI